MKKSKPSQLPPAQPKPQYVVWYSEGYCGRYETLAKARSVAEQVCNQEQTAVFVLADIIKCTPSECPVTWVEITKGCK